jgi:branched-chain amino acid transport system permease protein
MTRWLLLGGLAVLCAAPLAQPPVYFLHLAILVLIWGLIGTAWSYMGRFGLVSLGHGGFMGVAAYATALLWNGVGLTPWLGIPLGIALALLLAAAIGYPAFRFRVLGHYFALVTLALGEVVRLSIIAARDVTGGSLGMTLERVQPATDVSWYALQFADKRYFYYLALAGWLFALWVWRRIDRGMGRSALEAISEDEVAAASVGIHVTREKLRVTVISAAMTALGGVLLGLYYQYFNPESLSGIGISLQIVFAAIVGGMYSAPGPTIGALLTITFRESLRVYFGVELIGMAETIYGLLLIVFIIFMPRGIYGSCEAWVQARLRPPPQPPPGEPRESSSPAT